MSQMNAEGIADWFRALQDRICAALVTADGGTPFQEDLWERPGGGGGRTRVLRGKHIEKGGVNFSAVHGELSTQAAQALNLGEGGPFFATGVSIVLHPRNPQVPIIHMNVRYFEMDDNRWWFGGGIDLTPHYVVPEDARWFHEQLATVCARFHPEFYPRFKQWADDYFFIRHRQETRGVGGIFYDRLGPDSSLDKPELWGFTQAVGEAFAPIYIELLSRHQEEAYGESELAWQRLRRGRYVEFNLVWDRGTKFGLETDGRTESILMSLPPLAGWAYDHKPSQGSREAETLSWLKKDQDWIGA
jgi:coproporphyrinogen III oxidase